MSKVASDSMPRSSVTAPWPDNDLQDLFIEVVPELVDISRLAALATGEPEIAARLEQRLAGPYGQDFVDSLIRVLQNLFPLRRDGLLEALHRAGAEAQADAGRFSENSESSAAGAAGGHRPDLLDAPPADTEDPVVQVDGRIAMARDQLHPVAEPELRRAGRRNDHTVLVREANNFGA
jgi:hypothetical protein